MNDRVGDVMGADHAGYLICEHLIAEHGPDFSSIFGGYRMSHHQLHLFLRRAYNQGWIKALEWVETGEGGLTKPSV